MMGFPYERGTMPPGNYILALLAAAVLEHGGELRLKARNVAKVSLNSSLIKSCDDKRGDIVLRFGPSATYVETFDVAPKQWRQPSPANPQPQAPQPKVKHSPVRVPQTLEEAEELLSEYEPPAYEPAPQRETKPRATILTDASLWLREREMQDRVRNLESKRATGRAGVFPWSQRRVSPQK